MKPYPDEELDRMSKREIIRLYKRTVEQFNDAVPIRHGKYIGTEFDGYADGCPVYYEWKCSECGCVFEEEEPTYNYCPYCGAKMDAERKEEFDCNDCYYSMQNCNDRSICCEDETALCDNFEPVAERKKE